MPRKRSADSVYAHKDTVFSFSPVFLWNLSPKHFIKICCISDLNCWSSEFFGPWSERVAAASRRRIAPEAEAVFIDTHNMIYCCFAFGHGCISCLMEGPPTPLKGFSLIQQRSKAALLEVGCIISLALRPSHKTSKRPILHQGPSRCHASQEGPPANQGPALICLLLHFFHRPEWDAIYPGVSVKVSSWIIGGKVKIASLCWEWITERVAARLTVLMLRPTAPLALI